jgi:hypothetical protein
LNFEGQVLAILEVRLNNYCIILSGKEIWPGLLCCLFVPNKLGSSGDGLIGGML